MEFDKVSDSGNRRSSNTGSVRDIQVGKGKPHLVPPEPLRRLAKHFENGAHKYGERNWELGQPLSRYYNSAQRHLWAILEKKRDEDHYAAVMWNVACMMQTIDWIEQGTLPKELDDLGITKNTAAQLIVDISIDTDKYIQALDRLQKAIESAGLIG